MRLGLQLGWLLLPRRATLPAPPPQCACYSRPHARLGFHTRPQVGVNRSGCSKVDDRSGLRGPPSLGARLRGCVAAPGRPPSQRLAPAPALTRRLQRRQGGCSRSASREHKQGEEACVSAWAQCQRAGAGTQCPERAGERGTRTA